MPSLLDPEPNDPLGRTSIEKQAQEDQQRRIDDLNKPQGPPLARHYPSGGSDRRGIPVLSYLLALPLIIGFICVAQFIFAKPGDIPEKTLKSVLHKQGIEAVHNDYRQSFLLPAAVQPAFDRAYDDMLKRQPKVLNCSYQEEGKEGQYRFIGAEAPRLDTSISAASANGCPQDR